MVQELAKLSERGQIVIPKRIRDDLKLKAGSRLIVKEVDNQIIVEELRFNEEAVYDELKQKKLDGRLRKEGETFV